LKSDFHQSTGRWLSRSATGPRHLISGGFFTEGVNFPLTQLQ
jgi:hypothetical protein